MPPSSPNEKPLPRHTVSAWLQCLSDSACCARAWRAIYGGNAGVLEQRCDLLRSTLVRYRAAFGDHAVLIARAPARINLRGMHVDTHGGYLNLMSHQREAVFVAGMAPLAGPCRFVSLNYPDETQIAPRAWDTQLQQLGWPRFLADPKVMALVNATPGAWGHYPAGAYYRLRKAMYADGHTMAPIQGVVGGDIPEGAALSSSAALCVALLLGMAGLQGVSLTPATYITLARDAEWYSGARTGLCDQSAVILAQPDSMLHGALRPDDFSVSVFSAMPFPETLSVLVIDSLTRRSLSGAQRLAYVRNRFAYALALESLRQAGAAAGYPKAVTAAWRHLSDLSQERFGGTQPLYRLLQAIPETLSFAALERRFPTLDIPELAKCYFGEVLPAPDTPIPLRGPLLFGLAESERARVFPELLQRKDFTAAGRLMCVGHDGDRIRRADGKPYQAACDDAYLAHCMAQNLSLAACPGVYGASSSVLDALVDQALSAGALGASLTGAGIAGSVLALCRREEADRIAARLQDWMQGAHFMRLAGLAAAPDDTTVQRAVVMNQPIAGASILPFPGA